MKSLVLKDKMDQSNTVFYRQIPCALSTDPCIYKDLRDIYRDLAQVKSLALDSNTPLW